MDFCRITSDNQDNIFVSGSYFQNCYLTNDTLHALGKNDLFLIKYDGNGNELWSKTIGGQNPNSPGISTDQELAGDILFDSISSCLYFVGSFYENLQIDSHSVVSTGKRDIFLAKFDLTGTCQWIKRAGSSGDDVMSQISIDNQGFIYWSGTLENTGTLDSLILTNIAYLCKVSPDGELVWVKNIISEGVLTNSIILENSFYFTGYFSNTVTIDSLTMNCTDDYDFFIGKYNLSSNHINWVKQVTGGNTLSNNVLSIILPEPDQLYIYGTFNDSIFFGNSYITNNNLSDIYFIRLDSNGTFKWYYQCHTNDFNYWAPGQLRIGKNNKYYATGSYKSRLIFGNDTLTTNKEAVFISQFDLTGQFSAILTFGEAQSSGMCMLSDGSIVSCGNQIHTTTIGDTIFNNIIGDITNRDNYIAKFDAITGIQTISKPSDNKLFIYANPTTGLCTIEIPEEFEHEPQLTLFVYDQQGRLLKQAEILMEEEKVKLNLEALAKGMYTAVITNGKKQYSGKIIFQ